jgi:rhamnogalacturonan endolyase
MKSSLPPHIVCVLLALLVGAFISSAAERLDRGVAVLTTSQGQPYVGWRLLSEDPPDIAFHLFRSATAEEKGELVATMTNSCNYVDAGAGGKQWFYTVAAMSGGKQLSVSAPVRAQSDKPYVRIPLRGKYRAQKVGLADLNGDGQLDYIVKQPDFNTDPYQQPGYWKKSEGTYRLEAYLHDGTFLWEYDMGWSIEQGIWYSPVIVYDLDGDGRAEVFCKAGEGDPREPAGHVRSGPEYLVMLDGMSGEVKKRLPWPSRDGFEDYNRSSRNMMGIAYLDGIRPHLIIVRGTYGLIKVEAYDPSLALKWRWEASGQYSKYRGQGMHGMHAADVDGDGRDEVVIGSAVLDDDGKPLWTTGLGHPDVCYVADVDPSRPGLEIFYGIEPGGKSNTVCLVEARTGKMIWGSSEITVHVHGQGMVGDIIPEEPGLECYAGEAKGGTNYWLFSAGGKRLSNESLGELSPKAIYWLDGPAKVFISGNKLLRYPDKEIGAIEGRIIGIADCIGDWREEVITTLPGEIRIYSTAVPAASSRVCLMQDRLYRTDVAKQTMGYFYPPQLGGYGLPAQSVSRGYSIPLIDLASETDRQVILDREDGQYLGHPTTVLLEDGATMLCVYPKGHGRGPIVLKRSVDGGRTWSERLPVPENWSTSQETPTIHRVIDLQGKKRLIVWSGLYPARLAVSEDDGHTWSPLRPAGDWGGIVVMSSVEPLMTRPGEYLAMFHDDGRFFASNSKQQKPVVFTLYQTFSSDGGLTWNQPEPVFASSDVHLCEPGSIRSPDGRELAVLLRENSRRRNSHIIFSRDEGKTWSEPREVAGALTGDRHTARYAADGRLFISFRDTTLDSSTKGDWVAWVGTYADLAGGREGGYRIRLMDNTRDADCAYPGVELLPDGTIVTTTYGHWARGKSPYIVSVRLKLSEMDALLASGQFVRSR